VFFFFLFVLFLFFTAGNFIRYELKSQHETKTDRNYVMCIAGLTFVRKCSKKVFYQTIVIFSASEMAFQSMSPRLWRLLVNLSASDTGYWAFNFIVMHMFQNKTNAVSDFECAGSQSFMGFLQHIIGLQLQQFLS